MSDSPIESLAALPVGQHCCVTALLATGAQRRRMLELGIVQGARIAALHQSPAGDPKAYLIQGAVIALRAEDAQKVQVQF